MLNDDVLILIWTMAQCPFQRRAMRIAIRLYSDMPRDATELACKYIGACTKLSWTELPFACPVPSFASTLYSTTMLPKTGLSCMDTMMLVDSEPYEHAHVRKTLVVDQRFACGRTRVVNEDHFLEAICFVRPNYKRSGDARKNLNLDRQNWQYARDSVTRTHWKKGYTPCQPLNRFCHRMLMRNSSGNRVLFCGMWYMQKWNCVDAMQLIIDEYGGEEFIRGNLAARREHVESQKRPVQLVGKRRRKKRPDNWSRPKRTALPAMSCYPTHQLVDS